MSEQTKLVKALWDMLRRKGGPAHLLAREAGVANRTFSAVLNMQFANDPLPSADSEKCHRRQLRGYTESLIKLAQFARLPIEETLIEYGIDPDWQSVSQAIVAVKSQRQISADTLEHVKSDGVVVVGILSWWSLFPDAPDNTIETVWASRYVRTLLACLNPSLRIEFRWFDDVRIAIESLLTAPPEIHMLFGVSDTPFRRLQGLEFVNLPGIGVPISALSIAPPELAMTFEDFLALRKNDVAVRNIQFMTLKDEVGDIFLKSHLSHCQEAANVIELEITDSPTLARELLNTANTTSRHVLFVADAVTTGRIEQEIQAILVELSSLHSASDRSGEILRRIAQTAHCIKSDSWPVYPLSIAVPRGATDWCNILDRCQREELFANEATLTSMLYQELLAIEDRFSPIPLTNQLTPTAAEHFCGMLTRAVNSLSNDSNARTTTQRVKRFLNAWHPSLRPREREPLYPDEYLSVLTLIERKILTGEAGFQANCIVTSGDIMQATVKAKGVFCDDTKLSRLVNASAEACKYWILPALASVGLLEEDVRNADGDLSTFAPSSFSGVYSVPGLHAKTPRSGRWMFWERYHCEVVFACLIGSKDRAEKQAAITCIQNKLKQAETLIRYPSSGSGHVADLVLSDREFHLSVCQWGSPDGRPETTIRNLERAFNRLNASLPPGTAGERFRDNFSQHSKILDAIQLSGSIPALEDYKKILDAYSTHFFRLREEYLAIDGDFLAKLEGSVLREVAALEHLPCSRFFEHCKCQILRSKNILPLEWTEEDTKQGLVLAISNAIRSGATMHYVILGAPANAQVTFNRFIHRIGVLLEQDGKSLELVRQRVFWFPAELVEGTPFVDSLGDDQVEACLIYGGDSVGSAIQLTSRRKNVDGLGPGEIRRQIDATAEQKHRFCQEYVEFLQAVRSSEAESRKVDATNAVEAIATIMTSNPMLRKFN